jgi:2-polyprenyl-6-hydroxyphenyl methylase/3-demethylubiquinone-9 3-methyltransferase
VTANRPELSPDSSVETSIVAINGFVERDLMPSPDGLLIWDVGCGFGEFSRALRAMGASVIGSDLVLQVGEVADPEIIFIEGDISGVRSAIGDRLLDIDLVFMHLMTEHVHPFRDFVSSIFQCLRPGAQVLIHHDNYYQPVGHHDHGLLFLDGASWRIVPQGVQCWESLDRCAASEHHRKALGERFPWLWSDDSEGTRDPLDCSSCNYYRRSQPWAHLLYGRELHRTFPELWFRTNLNRLSPDQVLWDVQDAGFEVARAERTWVQNEAPESLVLEFGRHTLTTFTLTLRLLRP